MKFKPGDRVIYKSEKSIIMERPDVYENSRFPRYMFKSNTTLDYGDNNRYFIKILNKLNKEGYNVTTWVSGDDIHIDIQYYRNIRFNKILKKINTN